ncbi:MAG: YigZ family protein [Clostridiaceae bacterium]
MYFTVLKEESFEYEEKKSIFIGYVKRCENEEDAKEFVSKIKNKHKDARHNCYAYVIGENMGIQRYSDDGEPQGTAGIPIIDVIKKKNLTNVAVIVTRYFGGVLLGAGGLVRAYTKAASEAINTGEVVAKVLGRATKLKISYDLLGKIQYFCSTNNYYIEDTQYSDNVEVELYIEEEKLESFKQKVVEATNGKIEISEEGITHYFKLEDRLYKET